MKGNELMENFNTSQFTVRMSRDTYTQLRSQSFPYAIYLFIYVFS